MKYSPIIIVTLNRFEHFVACVESLKKCKGAMQTELYVGLDYPYKEEVFEGYYKIKEYLKTVDGFSMVHILEHPSNVGVFENINLTRNLLFEKHDTYIFTEDDNLFSPNFLEYMNQNLSQYEKEKDIIAVSGYMYPIETNNMNGSVVRISNYFSAFGYGTWKDKIETINYEIPEYINNLYKNKKLMKEIQIKSPNQFGNYVKAIIGYTHDFLKGEEILCTDLSYGLYMMGRKKYMIFPAKSKVKNMGFDGSGAHCDKMVVDTTKESSYRNFDYATQTIDTSDEFNLPIEEKEYEYIESIIEQFFPVPKMEQLRVTVCYKFLKLCGIHTSKKVIGILRKNMNKTKKEKIVWTIYDTYNYILHYIRYRKFQVVKKVTGKEHWGLPLMVAGRWLLSKDKVNEILIEKINQNKPYWCGRFGGTEMNAIYQYLSYSFGKKEDKREDAIQRLCHLSGFFPNDLSLGEQFVTVMLEESKHVDLLAMWRRYMEDYIFTQYQPNTKMTQLNRIEPWHNYKDKKRKSLPWSSALKGKKVLVIHPFVESIYEQYTNNRERIFEKVYLAEEILPEFELLTLKAVQTLGGEADERFQTWFDALEWMTKECEKIEFDVAIIGCGAYGFPLAARIKKMGKVAIHLGGATQVLFGVIGSRWETEYSEFYKDVVNEHWVRPKESERIQKAETIEGACYW